MTPREISDIFADIELRLIRSLKKHLRVVKGDDIHSWQGRCLRSIERYRRQNATVFSSFSPDVERAVTELLQKSFINGVETVEAEHRLAFPDANLEGTFSGINSDRLDSLIEDVNEHLHTAETSSLQMMDDVYRSVIYKAELAQATGSVTMQQAVDMAVQDFLERGINSIEYADGRRVNIASYAEMALRSASTRSMLRGEAQKRQQLGVDTVLVSQYGACSDTCLPWQGKVYIDDVWGQSDGYDVRDGKAKSINGKWYRLLSEAVEAGLFHPNCRHSVSTWYEGVSKMPTPLDATAVRRAAELERRQRELERKVRRFKRLEEGSQDEETVAKYRRKRIAAQKQLREFVRDNDDVLRRDYWREKTHAPKKMGVSNQYLTPTVTDSGNHPVDAEVVQMVETSTRRFATAFPSADSMLQYAMFTPEESDNPAELQFQVTGDGKVKFGLAFNSNICHNLDGMKTLVTRESQTGGHIKTSSPEAIVYHECGHAAFYAHCLHAAGYTGGNLTAVQMNVLAQKLQELRKQVYLEAFPDFHGTHEDLVKEIQSTISSRAADSAEEFVAECFSQYFAGKPSIYARRIVLFFKKLLR